jgi:hypothetical protein
MKTILSDFGLDPSDQGVINSPTPSNVFKFKEADIDLMNI